MCIVPEEEIQWAETLCKLTSSKTGDENDDFFERIMQQEVLQLPTTWDEAVALYLHLTS